MSWFNLLKEPEKLYQAWIVGKGSSIKTTWETLKERDRTPLLFTSRQEALNYLKESFSRGNPAPWTVEGNLYEGAATVYDGAAIVLGAPSYLYAIIRIGEKPPPKDELTTTVARNVLHKPNKVVDRIEGSPYDHEEDDFNVNFKEGNE